MFDLSNDVTILKNRIRLLEIRKKRLLDASRADDGNSLYWVQSDLQLLENEISEAKRQLAEKRQVSNKPVGTYNLSIQAAVDANANTSGTAYAAGASAFELGSVTVESVRMVHNFAFLRRPIPASALKIRQCSCLSRS